MSGTPQVHGHGPERQVRSADARVRGLIGRIIEIVREDGGFVHPALVFCHEGPHLWTEFPRGQRPQQALSKDPVVLRIPQALHIPVVLDDWPESDDHLTPPAELTDYTPVQRELLLTMVELFNVCDKVRSIGNRYPNLELARDPELLDLIRQARPAWPQTTSTSPSRNFLTSRLGSDGWAAGDDAPPHLMPLIDMMNHHPHGAQYEYDAQTVLIRPRHGEAGDEIYLRYNEYDALAVALHLGYFEPAAQFVASVTCRLDVPGVGVVVVEGVDLERRRLPAPAVEVSADGLHLVGLQLSADTVAAQTVLLSMALRSAGIASEAEAGPDAVGILRQACIANTGFFDHLARAAEAADNHLRQLMGAVGRHQITLLEEVLEALA